MKTLILNIVLSLLYFNAFSQNVTTVLDYGVGNTSSIFIDNNRLYATYAFISINRTIVEVDLLDNSFPNSTFIDMGNSRSIGGLTIYNNYLYIAVAGSITNHLREIYRVDLTQPSPVLEEVAKVVFPNAIDVWNNKLLVNSNTKIYSIDLLNNNPVPEEIISDLTLLENSGTYGICVVGDYLYVTEKTRIVKYNLNNTPPAKELVVSGFNKLGHITLSCSGDELYFANFMPGGGPSADAIYALDLQTYDWEIIYNTGFETNTGLYCYGSYLYISSYGPEIIRLQVEPLSNPSFTAQKLSVYPNPVSDIIYIDGLDSQEQAVVYNTLSQVLMEVKVTNQLDISGLIKGVYFLKIGDRLPTKIIKK